MAENPRNIIRSWNLQTNFATGPVVKDNLVPPSYGRIRTPHICTWREFPLENTLDWGASEYSFFLPQSLRVIKNLYLKIRLPALNAGNYRRYCGLYAIRNLRILSAGQEVYSLDVQRHYVDYMESLTNDGVRQAGETFFGDKAAPDGTERNVYLPILLPNSCFMGRQGDRRGLGVFPAFLGKNQLELAISLNASSFVTEKGADAAGSVVGRCSICAHVCEMTANNNLKYSDSRGGYSIVGRRFTEITPGWQTIAAGQVNVEQVLRNIAPQGTVTEIFVHAVPDEANEEDRSAYAEIRPTSMRITADSIVQKNLADKDKVEIELWEQNFNHPTEFPSPGRLCLAAGCADNTHCFSGGYVMTLASNIDLHYTLPVQCRYRIYATALQRVRIDPSGTIRAYLE